MDVTPFPNHCTIPLIVLNPPPPTANVGGPYSPVCGNFQLNGSTTNATTSTYSTSGTGTFNPNATTLNAVYQPSASDLTNGVTITLTATGTGPNAVSQTNVTFTSTNDGNACTTDACNSSTGTVSHTAVNIDDNNVCTFDGCDCYTVC